VFSLDENGSLVTTFDPENAPTQKYTSAQRMKLIKAQRANNTRNKYSDLSKITSK